MRRSKKPLDDRVGRSVGAAKANLKARLKAKHLRGFHVD